MPIFVWVILVSDFSNDRTPIAVLDSSDDAERFVSLQRANYHVNAEFILRRVPYYKL